MTTPIHPAIVHFPVALTVMSEFQDQLDKLAALPDEQIDTTDIPEAPPEAWLHARRPGLYRPVKKPVTLRLDADVVAWFKERARTWIPNRNQSGAAALRFRGASLMLA